MMLLEEELGDHPLDARLKMTNEIAKRKNRFLLEVFGVNSPHGELSMQIGTGRACYQ